MPAVKSPMQATVACAKSSRPDDREGGYGMLAACVYPRLIVSPVCVDILADSASNSTTRRAINR